MNVRQTPAEEVQFFSHRVVVVTNKFFSALDLPEAFDFQQPAVLADPFFVELTRNPHCQCLLRFACTQNSRKIAAGMNKTIFLNGPTPTSMQLSRTPPWLRSKKPTTTPCKSSATGKVRLTTPFRWKMGPSGLRWMPSMQLGEAGQEDEEHATASLVRTTLLQIVFPIVPQGLPIQEILNAGTAENQAMCNNTAENEVQRR